MDKKLDQRLNSLFSRRKFLAGAGTAAAVTMVGCSDSGSPTPAPVAPGSTFTDADVLNFALNLEYLEAQFYLYAATGAGLATADITAPSGYNGKFTQGTVTTTGAITAGKVAGTTTAQQNIINEIAYEEQAHVRFLRSALGSAAVPQPALDLTFFAALAVAAGVAGATATGAGAFSPYASFDAFLIGSFIFEDVGVTAYSGAAPLISKAGVSSGYLTAAAGILAVEAYHAAYVRTALTGSAIAKGATTPTSAVYPFVGIANQVVALRSALTVGYTGATGTGGNAETSLTVPTSISTPSAIVAADPTAAVGFSRNVNQVHHIVYGSPMVGVAKGGFFPNGTNSIFATTTA